MEYRRQQPYVIRFGFGSGAIGPALKYFMVACVVVFVAQIIYPKLEIIFGLMPYAVLHNGWAWQLLTFHFLHGGLWHIFLNLFALWMFGTEIERVLGTKKFVIYMVITGVGAGIASLIATPNLNIPIVGASGVVYGILLAFGLLFPERLILVFFLFPLKAKYMVLIFGGLELLSTVSDGGATGIAHAAHLGGMVFGAIYLYWDKIRWKLRNSYYRAKLKKLRKRYRIINSNRDQNLLH